MHSYLLISGSLDNIENTTEKIIGSKGLIKYPFELSKIDDLRNLRAYLKLNIVKPTAIVIHNIDKATNEAVNGFLKSLEEPQKNITYILTAASRYGIPETIISRCQVIILTGDNTDKNIKALVGFLKKTESEKLKEISLIKDRESAVLFVKELSKQSINALHLNEVNLKRASIFIEELDNTYSTLMKNGNVNLALTNFVLNIE